MRLRVLTIVGCLLLALHSAAGLSGCKGEPPEVAEGESQSGPSQVVPTIPGMNPLDVTEWMYQAYGMSFEFRTESSTGGPWYVRVGSVHYPDDHVVLCNVSSVLPDLLVFDLGFTVSDLADGRAKEEFSRIAADRLAYCARIPYDGADPDAAEAWVRSSIADEEGEKGEARTTIGDVTLHLSWAKLGQSLTLYRAGAGGGQ